MGLAVFRSHIRERYLGAGFLFFFFLPFVGRRQGKKKSSMTHQGTDLLSVFIRQAIHFPLHTIYLYGKDLACT